jgi:magnesium-transporting ATPase (P-type)
MLNQIINLFWTIACFLISGAYWGLYFAEKRSPWVLAIFIALSILTAVTPRRWLSALTLSKNRKVYERIGVKILLFFVQNGTLVNRIQRKYNKKSGIIHNRIQAKNYLKTIAIQERFHYSCFTLFLLTTISACATGKPGMALLILLCNVLYNVYPILLQQYNRLRIAALIRSA